MKPIVPEGSRQPRHVFLPGRPFFLQTFWQVIPRLSCGRLSIKRGVKSIDAFRTASEVILPIILVRSNYA